MACQVGEERDDIDGDVRDVVVEERGIRLRFDPNPDDVEWGRLDSGAVSRSYPHLWALFGERWR